MDTQPNTTASNTPELLVRPEPKKSSPIFIFLAIGGVVVAIGLLLMAGVIFFQNFVDFNKPSQKQVACTMEAMLCPDGSSVGRQGPNCEFAACPSSDEVPNQACPRDTFTCTDGTNVIRTGPNCEFVCSDSIPTFQSTEMKTYTSKKYAYSFGYPTTWEFNPYQEDNPEVKGGAHTMSSYISTGMEKYMDHGSVDWKSFLGDTPAIKLDISMQDLTVEQRAGFESFLGVAGLNGTPTKLQVSNLQIGSLQTVQLKYEMSDNSLTSTYYAYPNEKQAIILTVFVSNSTDTLYGTPEWGALQQTFQSFKFNL